MRWVLLATYTVILTAPVARPEDKPKDIPVSELGDKFRLIGKLGVPLGEVVTVQGFVGQARTKLDVEPQLRVQRINGKATQEDIQIAFDPIFGEFGDKGYRGVKLPKLATGVTYEFEGYQTGRFVGIPGEVHKKADIPIPGGGGGFLFHHELLVYKGTNRKTIVWSPADFVDREALIEGKAVSRDKKAYIDGDGWRLLTDPAAGWPRELEGKTVEGFGTVKQADGGGYKLEKGVTRLVKLGDQKGRAVELRGTAWSLNGHWWFEYRGTQLYVENQKELFGEKAHGMHSHAVIITGILDEADLPDLDQITLKSKPDKKKYFIVRKAGWKPLDALLSPERVERE